jgi:hypothetical protein
MSNIPSDEERAALVQMRYWQMFSGGADQYLRPWLDKYINDLISLDPSKSGGTAPTNSNPSTGGNGNPASNNGQKRSLFEMALGL